MQKIRRLLSITAVKLSILYSVIFAIIALIIIFYMTGASVSYIVRQIQTSIEQEVVEVSQVYNRGGINRMIRLLEAKARAPGANLYVVTDPSGVILAGNVYAIEDGIMQQVGWTRRPFHYSRFADENTLPSGSDDDNDRFDRFHEKPLALARVMELPNGLRVLIGRDVSERDAFRKIVGRVLLLALGSMLLLGILTWFFVGRSALKRLDLMSHSTSRIMAGDRNERLPVAGNGDEFDRLSTRLNAMLDRIFKLDEGLKQVSDNIAHDLKTPITRLRNKIEAGLSGSANPEDYRKTMEEALADCDGVIKTFNALLMISRVESGSAVAELQDLDFSSIVGDVAELYEPVAEEGEFGFSTNIASGIHVRGNRELLSQAISNIIENSIKYCGTVSAPRISITLSAEQKRARLVISDNGPGIPPEDRDKVFDRFTRLEKSRNLPGNGLGLSLVAAVAKLHEGEVELRSGNPGLVVELDLPIYMVEPKNSP